MTLERVPWRTVARPATFSGHGLFCAEPCLVCVEPAEVGRGLVFVRDDLPGAAEIPVCSGRVIARPRQTVLAAPGDAGVSVQTVEHLLSALTALGVNTAVLRVRGPEVPILDGSARLFVEGLSRAGVTGAVGEGAAPAPRPIVVDRRIELSDGATRIVAEPWPAGGGGPRLGLTYELDYEGAIAAQSASFEVRYPDPDRAGYAERIAPARTFCTEAEALRARSAGLFGHIRAEDVLVIGPAGPIGTAYRVADEPARHKVLDLIGDLTLAGGPIHGRISAVRSGHALNHRLARALAEHGADPSITGP